MSPRRKHNVIKKKQSNQPLPNPQPQHEVITIYNWLHAHENNVCLFVLEFYGPVNNEVMSSRSVNCGTIPGQP